VRCALLAPVCILLPLAGCTPTDKAAGPGSQPAQATAPPVQAPIAPQPAAPPAPRLTAQQQRVHQLIAQVEAAYAAGDADYRKGQLAEAKIQFDRAVDLMLSSGLDIKADPQLQDEFDKIVDQVNGLEMEALKQGNGFVPKEEITPAEAASDVTFAVDPNLVAKATADLATTKSDLPLVMNNYVATFINFFAYTQKGHNTLLHSFQRSGRYKPMIERILAEEGVPQDLIYLAVAESGFQPKAIDRKSKAGGMWQFMPGPYYGLTRNAYVDERFDPEKSTRAYARYMKFIYDQLGDWYLSMAGYDWGAGNVQRAVQKTGYADFWELYKRNNLPAETKNYVPEILAAIIIANHPTQYGFDDVTLDPPVLTDTVTINYPVDLRLVSDLVAAPVDELMALNPSLLRLVTPPDAAFDLHLPAGMAAVFELAVTEDSAAWRNLAQLWGVTLGPGQSCAVAPAAGLRCYRVSGGLETIRQLYRPGFLKLVREDQRVGDLEHGEGKCQKSARDEIGADERKCGAERGPERRCAEILGCFLQCDARLLETGCGDLSEVDFLCGTRSLFDKIAAVFAKVEVDDNQPSAGAQCAMDRGQHLLWVVEVVVRIAEEGNVNGAG